ncbi:MAG: hypothetical protein ACFFAV_15830 [Candidatus Hermodarchaeota archaeon]
MIDLKKDAWFYAILASILIMISLFTPARMIHSGVYGDMLQWLGGSVMLQLNSGMLHEDLFGVLLFGGVMISITLLLTISINTRRGNEFKQDSIIYLFMGVIISILTILYWIFEFDPTYETLGFATIGILISGILSIIAFLIARFNKGRNELSISQ